MEAIALIGMAGRFPKAANVIEYWRNLCAGIECIHFFSEAELVDAGISPDLVRRPAYVRAKGVLDDAECFDAAFFGYHPREAEVIDPQQRLLLESAWTAMEDAGYAPNQFPEAVGVFVGVSMNTYLVNNLLSNRRLLETIGGYQVMISNDKDYAATRISYLLNLTGPSLSVQTACSSSLVAVERACQSLVYHECDMALAGGASLSYPRRAGYLYQDGMILSPDGHCRVFDARARGTVGGEGVGIVVLKRLSDARRDGDNVLAVIRGWATNNDGSAKMGYTAPAVNGQAAVIATAQAMAGIDPRSITYVEAHGTGTELGDPVEISALAKVFGVASQEPGFCRIGSVKSNIGHLDAAAGIAGLIKTTLALQNRCIPPSLHFQQANPHIDFTNGPFRVNTELFPWKTDQLPRRAAVSSFGIGGTNAHLVLEENSADDSARRARQYQLMPLSAKSETALELATTNLTAFLKGHSHVDLADVAFTLQVGRKEFSLRRALVCRNTDDANEFLQGSDGKRLLTSVERLAEPRVAFLFPGQGVQHLGMGHQIYESEECYRQHFDNCAQLLQTMIDVDIREILFRESPDADGDSILQNTAIAQPLLFAVEYSLAKQWEEWGIRPAAMIGHSLGELVAACLASVFSINDALTIVAKRGQLMQSIERGAMLAVPLSEQEIVDLLKDGLSLAACNSPMNSVVSGPLNSVTRLEEFLRGQGVESHRLHTSHAFHSPMLQPICEQFRSCVEQVARHPPTIPFISNVTGTWITSEQAVDSRYWVEHLLKTVRYSDGIKVLMGQSRQILLEVGPGQTLTTLTRQVSEQATQNILITSMRHPHEVKSDTEVLLQALARIWLAGGKVDWAGFHAHEQRRRVSLPAYPFERKRYMVEQRGDVAAAAAAPSRNPPSDWFYAPCWKQHICPSDDALSSTPEIPDTWLLMMDISGVGVRLQERLKRGGHQVMVVHAGNSFSVCADGSYTVQPQRFGDYIALFNELQRRGSLPGRIVHLWNVSPDQSLSFDEYQSTGFYSLLYLAQVLGRQPATSTVQIDVISSGLQEVTGAECTIPEKATLRGPLLVIPQEYPHVIMRSIDIELPEEMPLDSSHDDRLLRELKKPVTSIELALRGRYCWTRVYEKTLVQTPRTESALLRERGVYWIIGGLGQIGLAMAHELARSVRAKIVLTGRNSLPPRDQWENWVDQRDPDDPDVQRCRQLLELEALGAEIMVAPADIADPMQMRDVLERINHRFGDLHGIILSAGRVEGRMIHYLTSVDCEDQFHAKVRGLFALTEVISDRPLDFCLITSSLSSVIGGMGFCAYTAANAFMDAFALCRSREGTVRWFSVNWDGWRFDRPDETARQPLGLEMLLSATDGSGAFARLLSTDCPERVVVSTGDLQLRIDQWVSRHPIGIKSDSHHDQDTSRHPRPTNLSAEFVEPRNELEITIVELWQQMLGIERIGIHDNYIELGGHSLMAAQLISRLRESLKVPLSIRNLFESPTIAQFASYVETQRWALQALQSSSTRISEDSRDEIEL